MRRVQALVGLLLLAGLFNGSYQAGMKLGPYDIIIDYVSPCEDASLNKFGVYLQPNFKKINGVNKLMYSGGGYSPLSEKEFEALEVKADYYQRKSNDFLFMYRYNENLCAAINVMARNFYNVFLKQLGLKPEGCAIPPGNYSFTDWDMSFKLPMPMLEYMTYKAIVHVISAKQEYLCLEAIATVKRKY